MLTNCAVHIGNDVFISADEPTGCLQFFNAQTKAIKYANRQFRITHQMDNNKNDDSCSGSEESEEDSGEIGENKNIKHTKGISASASPLLLLSGSKPHHNNNKKDEGESLKKKRQDKNNKGTSDAANDERNNNNNDIDEESSMIAKNLARYRQMQLKNDTYHSFHVSPDGQYIAVVNPFGLRHRVIYTHGKQDVYELRTSAPILSCTWHPEFINLLLILLRGNTVEVHDVSYPTASGIVQPMSIYSLNFICDLERPVSGPAANGIHSASTPASSPCRKEKEKMERNRHHHVVHTSPSPKLNSRQAGFPSVPMDCKEALDDKTDFITQFVSISTVPRTTACPPLLLILGNNRRGQVFSSKLGDRGDLLEKESIACVFQCFPRPPSITEELMDNLEERSATDLDVYSKSPSCQFALALSVNATLIDYRKGLYMLTVFHSNGKLYSGVVDEKHLRLRPTMTTGNSKTNAAPHHITQLFAPLDLSCREKIKRRTGGVETSGGALSPKGRTQQQNESSTMKTTPPRSGITSANNVIGADGIVATPNRRSTGSGSPSSLVVSKTNAVIQSSSSLKYEFTLAPHFPAFFQCTHLHNMLLIGVTQFEDGLTEDGGSSVAAQMLQSLTREEIEDWQLRDPETFYHFLWCQQTPVTKYALVHIPVWDERRKVWAVDEPLELLEADLLIRQGQVSKAQAMMTTNSQHTKKASEDSSRMYLSSSGTTTKPLLPPLSTLQEFVPPPLCSILPMDFEEYNVTLGDKTLALVPRRIRQASPLLYSIFILQHAAIYSQLTDGAHETDIISGIRTASLKASAVKLINSISAVSKSVLCQEVPLDVDVNTIASIPLTTAAADNFANKQMNKNNFPAIYRESSTTGKAQPSSAPEGGLDTLMQQIAKKLLDVSSAMNREQDVLRHQTAELKKQIVELEKCKTKQSQELEVMLRRLDNIVINRKGVGVLYEMNAQLGQIHERMQTLEAERGKREGAAKSRTKTPPPAAAGGGRKEAANIESVSKS